MIQAWSFVARDGYVEVAGTPEVGVDVYGSLSGWALDIKSGNRTSDYSEM